MFLSNVSYPPDLRVLKEGKSLLKMGHIVIILCNKKGNQKKRKKIDGFLVIRLFHILHKIPKVGEFLQHTFEKYKFTIRALLLSKQYNVDIIHVHDLPLVIPALLTSKILRKPLIIDFHENYVHRLESEHGTTLIMRFLCRLFSLEESIGTNHADKIIVVMDEAKKRLMQEHDIDSSKIFTISNTADIQDLSEISKHAEPKELDKFSVLYVGGFSKHRGLDTLISTISLLPSTSKIRAYIVGGGNPPERKRIKKLIEDLNVKERVKIISELRPAETARYMMGATVCIVPHLSNPHTEATIPHKIFNYMYFMKPIIVSDVGPLKRIVDECHCGKVFKAGDSISLKECLLHLEKNPSELERMGKNAYDAILNKYNWGREEKKLQRIYSTISDVKE